MCIMGDDKNFKSILEADIKKDFDVVFNFVIEHIHMNISAINYS